MKEKWKKIGKSLFAFAMILSMLIGTAIPSWADPYEAGRQGSITVTLPDLGTVRSGVPLSLYKVGSLVTSPQTQYTLDAGFASSGVNFNDLKTTENAVRATKALEAAIPTSQVSPISFQSDAYGKIVFPYLNQGVYLLIQQEASDYGVIQPMLVACPAFDSTNGWMYHVDISAKATAHETRGQITVTKRTYYVNEDLEWVPLVRQNQTFYVGLFYDEAGTIPAVANNIRPIPLVGTSTNRVTYTDLPAGTYYAYETDASGKIISPGTLLKDAQDKEYRCFFGTGLDTDTNKMQLSASQMTGSTTVSNVYLEYPDGEYLSAELSIGKRVLKNGNSVHVADTFYAGVFHTDEAGEETLVMVVKLEQNDSVQVELPLGGADGTEDITYTVKETDKDGNPVNKSTFAYKVSGEGDVSFTETSLKKSITITNQANSSTPTVTPTATPVPSRTPGNVPGTTIRSTTSGTTTTSTTTSVKTGDETPVTMWIGLLGLSAILILAGVIKRKRNGKNSD